MAIAVASSTTRVNVAGLSATTATFSPAANTVLVCISHSNSDGGVETATSVISNTGTPLIWQRAAYSNLDLGEDGGVFIDVAVNTTAQSNITVKADCNTNNGSTPYTSIRVWVLTGVDTVNGPIGETSAGISGSNTLNTPSFAAIGDNSRGFAGFTDWTAPGGVPTSIDMSDGSGFSVTSTLAGYSGSKSLGLAGSSITFNVDAFGNSTVEWTWAAAEILAYNPTAPIVDIGYKQYLQLGDTYSVTAIEDDGGSAITARAWSITSGPDDVGALSSSASMTWTPDTLGAFVLQYQSTNAIGTTTKTITVNVIPRIDQNMDAMESMTKGILY